MSKPTVEHPWHWQQRNKGKRPAPASHPWRQRFNPLPFDAETTEAMKRQIEFQRKEDVFAAITTGYTAIEGGFRRDAVHYDDEAE